MRVPVQWWTIKTQIGRCQCRQLSASVSASSWYEARREPPSTENLPWCRSDVALSDEFYGLCKEGKLAAAFDTLFLMVEHGYAPSQYMYRSLLKACIRKKALTQARIIYAHLVVRGIEATVYLDQLLVITLANCRGQEDALYVFESLPHRSALSWTAIIYGYTSCGKVVQALEMYTCMLEDGMEPNEHTFVSLLKACGILRSLKEGKHFHAEAVKHSCESNPLVVARLLEMYSKCGSITEAECVFAGLSEHDVVSWTAMLTAYVEEGRAQEALELFKDMQCRKVKMNERTFVAAVQACFVLGERETGIGVDGAANEGAVLSIGKALHADARKQGLHSNEFILSSFVSLYGKWGSIWEMECVFTQLLEHSVVSWNSMLAAYVEKKQGEKALQAFNKMHKEGVSPSEPTFSCALQACSIFAEKEQATIVGAQSMKQTSLEIAKALHVDVQRKGFDSNIFIRCALIDLYGNCGSTLHARKVFDHITNLDVISWTIMLSAYVDQQEGEKALELYKQVRLSVSADERALLVALQACSVLAGKEDSTISNGNSTKLVSLESGQGLHADVCKKGFELDAFVCSALIGMYGKCGRMMEAESVFDGLRQRDVVLWTTMVTAYIEQGQGERALQVYKEMQEEGVSLNDTALVCILQACSETAMVDICREIHIITVSSGCNLCMILANSLIHSYGSCGALVDAHAVFNELPQPNVISWTSLITCYGRQGNYMVSLFLCEEMQLAGMKPNRVTFLSVLCACSHTGVVDKGVEYFISMSTNFGISPGVEHYANMIDLFGRVGDFAGVESLLSSMQKQPHLAMWLCTLNSCQKHGNVELGKQVFDLAVHLRPDQAVAYVLMSNMIANQGLGGFKDVVDISKYVQ